MKIRVQTPNIFYKFCTLANFHNCLINKLKTSLQIPSNLVLNRNYGQFCVLSLLFPKYGNSAPDPKYFQKFCSILNFHNCLIDTLPKSPRSPANFVSNSNSHQFIDFAGREVGKVEQDILRYFCGSSNNFLLKHARDLIFSLQVVNMMTTKKYYGDF